MLLFCDSLITVHMIYGNIVVISKVTDKPVLCSHFTTVWWNYVWLIILQLQWKLILKLTVLLCWVRFGHL